MLVHALGLSRACSRVSGLMRANLSKTAAGIIIDSFCRLPSVQQSHTPSRGTRMNKRQVGSMIASYFAVVCLCVQGGCSSNRAGPLQTSLTQLTSESRTFSGLALRQTEFVSLAGLIGVPAPGLIYHLSDESEQSSLFGVSYDTKSFLLIGESAPSTEDYSRTVNDLKREIESYDAMRADFSRDAGEYLASQIVLLQTGIDTMPKNMAKLQARSDELRIKLELHKEALRKAAVEISRLSSRPGIIVARWTRDSTGAARVEAIPFVAANAGQTDIIDGYVVLGGVRVVVPFFSMDAVSMFLDIEEASPGSLQSVGQGLGATSTYLLQAKEIAYTSSSSSSNFLSMDLSVSRRSMSGAAKALFELEKIRVQGLWESTRFNLSSGRIGQFEWKTVDLNFSNRWSVPEGQPCYAHEMRYLRDKAQRDLIASAWSGPRVPGAVTSDWITVVAQITQASTWAKYYARFYLPQVRGAAGVKGIEKKLTGPEVPALQREASDCIK